jgi:hypothetical protein
MGRLAEALSEPYRASSLVGFEAGLFFDLQNTVGTFVGNPVQKTEHLWVVRTILALPQVPVNY